MGSTLTSLTGDSSSVAVEEEVAIPSEEEEEAEEDALLGSDTWPMISSEWLNST